MTSRLDADPIANTTITTAQARAAALTVAARFPDDPGAVQMVLDMLGIRDRLRHPESVGEFGTNEHTGPAQPLVDTAAAAGALNMLEYTLNRFAQAHIVRPALTDPDGTRWWSLPELRGHIRAYLGEADGDPSSR